MIKIKSWSKSGGSVVAEVEYDMDSEIRTSTFKGPAVTVAKMTPEELKQWVRDQVDIKRAEMVWDQVCLLLDALIGVDLEA